MISTRHLKRPFVQIPSFKPRHAAPTVTLEVVKANHSVESITEIVVIASNTTVLGGIQDAWLEKGLRLPLSLQCGKPDACNVPNDCPIVWLETGNCMVLNESHFTLRPLELQAALAVLELRVRPLSLREGSYAYSIHVPVPNNLTLPTTVLRGKLEVKAVPSPQTSEAWVCSGVKKCDAATSRAPNFEHLSETFVYIVAKDIDGYTINRPDMLLSIIHVAETLNRSNILSAVYDSSTGRYFVALGNFDVPGQHRIFLAADAASEPSVGQFEKVRFSVECSDGYLINKDTNSCVNGLNTQWILAGAAAAALLVIGGLVILVRKRGTHLQAIMLMLLTEAAQLVFSIFTALANVITDGIVFSHLLRGNLKVSTEAYTAAYATLLCFAVVATVISVAYRIRNARLVQANVRQLAHQSHPLAAKEAHRQVQQHEWELAQTYRTKVTLLLSLLSVIVQGAPGSAKLVRTSATLTGRRARACACLASPCVRESSSMPVCRCRSAHVCRELLPDIRRRQHR